MKIVFFLILINTQAWALKLRFYDKIIIKHKDTYQGHRIGGLSGAYYEKQILYAISDDRGDYGKPRIHLFKLTVNKKPISLTPSGIILLKDINQQEFPKGEIDFEGIAKLSSGNFYLSSEGDNSKVPRLPPEIFEFDANGILKKRHSLPSKFVPHAIGILSKGIQDNLAFESLSSDNQKNSLITATEAPIIQDTLPGNNQFLRLLNIISRQGSLIEARESLYPINTQNGTNGLVELYIYDNQTIFSLERSWNPTEKKNGIKIYELNPDYEKLPNYKDIFSLRNKKVTPLKKKLIFDLALLVEKKLLRRLDNYEAMTGGPLLPNENRSLIIMSDNNFSPRQRTVLLILEIVN